MEETVYKKTIVDMIQSEINEFESDNTFQAKSYMDTLEEDYMRVYKQNKKIISALKKLSDRVKSIQEPF